MKKGIILFLLTIFLVFGSARIVFAYSFSQGLFGGKILNTVATEIVKWEAEGYYCPVFGMTISIKPMGSPKGTPKEYYISLTVVSKTKTIPAIGQLILGRYSGETIITCTNFVTGDVQNVKLATIDLFGTSRTSFTGGGGNYSGAGASGSY